MILQNIFRYWRIQNTLIHIQFPRRIKKKSYLPSRKKRKVLRDSSKDIDAFLKNLDMTAKFYKLSSKDLSRAVQLLSKTNQFNLTTKRHSESNLVSFLNKGGLGYTMRIADCFGTTGLLA